MQPLVAIEAVSKEFVQRTTRTAALSNVSLDVAPGEFLTILGPSGCGKSTMLMMLAGLETPTGGRILIDGAPVTGPSFENGIVFQDANLLPWKSVLDNVMLPIHVAHLDKAAYIDGARRLLDKVGLTEFSRHKPHQLSGGMRQRVALCRALIHDPKILLMDEPFSALDAITRDDMAILLLDLWSSLGKTAIFVTHSIREAVLLSDRVVVLASRPGRVLSVHDVPFERPRRFELTETAEFNQLCNRLRADIQLASQGGMLQ